MARSVWLLTNNLETQPPYLEKLPLFYPFSNDQFRYGPKPVSHLANLFARTEKKATRLAGDKH